MQASSLAFRLVLFSRVAGNALALQAQEMGRKQCGLFVAVASVLILSGVGAGQRGLYLAPYADTCAEAI